MGIWEDSRDVKRDTNNKKNMSKQKTQKADRVQHLEIVKSLYKAFDHFNSHYGLDLPTPVINVGAAGRRQALGWFYGESWENKDGTVQHEINISAEYLSRKPDDVLETMIHEIVHMVNRVAGVKDCSAGSQYHNKHFKNKAEELGLEVTKSGYRGWAWTKLGEGAKAAIKALPFDKQVFSIKRVKHIVKSSPYLTVVLDKDEWSSKLNNLMSTGLYDTRKELVEQALELLATQLVENGDM